MNIATRSITESSLRNSQLLPSERSAQGPSAKDLTLSRAVSDIITQKKQAIMDTLNNTRARYHPIKGTDTILIAGDVFNTGYLVFQAVKAFAPATAGMTGIAIASGVCGIVGGGINIMIALTAFTQGLKALKSGDTFKGRRLLFSAVMLLLVGTVMLLSSVAQLAGMAAVTGFFAANPWLLPTLFFIAGLPVLVEVLRNVSGGADIAAKLNLKEVQKLLEKKDWDAIKKEWKGTVLDIDKTLEEWQKGGATSLGERIDKIQAKMDPKVAVHMFTLFQSVLEQNKADAKHALQELQGRVSFWKGGQRIRLAQRVLFTGAFITSMIALRSPAGAAGLIRGIQNSAMTAASGIPLYLDFQPFIRNTPLIVPKIKVVAQKTLPSMPSNYQPLLAG